VICASPRLTRFRRQLADYLLQGNWLKFYSRWENVHDAMLAERCVTPDLRPNRRQLAKGDSCLGIFQKGHHVENNSYPYFSIALLLASV
jgi:hypothetical protein